MCELQRETEKERAGRGGVNGTEVRSWGMVDDLEESGIIGCPPR